MHINNKTIIKYLLYLFTYILIFLILLIIWPQSRPDMSKLEKYIETNDLVNIKKLLNNGFDPNFNFSENIINGLFSLFMFIITMGMICDNPDPIAKSPLFLAAKQKKWDIVDILLKYGAKDNSPQLKKYMDKRPVIT